MTNLASVLVDMGSPEVGEQLYRRVLEAEATHPDAAYNLALLLQDHKTDESNREAVVLYRITLLKDPTRWDAWANLAAALNDVGEEPKQAIRAFQRAVVLIEQATVEQGADEAQTGYLASLYFGLGARALLLQPTPGKPVSGPTLATPHAPHRGTFRPPPAAALKLTASRVSRECACIAHANSV